MTEKNNNLRYFAYVRKSTDDRSRQQLTVQAQLYEINAFVKSNGLEIVRIFEERRSAKLPGRPLFEEMLNEIRRGSADGIIAWAPDRLSRNSRDGGEIIYMLDTGALKDLKFPTHWFEMTSQGKYNLYQAFANSKLEVDKISDRVKTAYREKARRGGFPTKPPTGYRNNKKTKTIVIDAKTAPFVTKAFQMCASGKYTVPQLRSELTEAGFLTKKGKPLSVSKYHFILNHTFYYGIFKYAGEWYKGTHVPLIPKWLFEAAQRHLKRQNRKWSKEMKPFLYRGSLSCGECDAAITLEVQKGHGYLRCTKKKGPCSQPYLRAELLNGFLSDALASVALPKETLHELATRLVKFRDDIISSVAEEKAVLTQALNDRAEKQDRLLALLLDGSLTQNEFLKAKEKVLQEIPGMQDKLNQMDDPSRCPLEPVKTLLERLNRAPVLQKSADEQKKFEFLKILGSNLKIADRSLLVTWQKPFGVAAEWKKQFAQNAGSSSQKDTNELWLTLLSTARTFVESLQDQ